MLEQADSLCLHQLIHHVAENGAYGVEPLIRVTYVRQAGFVEQYLLYDKDSHRFRKFGTSFHDS